ncbi:MFS transporter [Pseudonocardia sp. GCM10023141]|uniref:MFS transporter n=1 Tax=Pseudonocardia sp. GCM10023141 TaxID=3252653 RepID=UPI00360E5F1E
MGAFVFGHIADRTGRKRATIIALGGVGATTIAIAALPGYQHLGVGAVVLLIILRLLGGVFLGGEYTGANPLAMELAPQARRGVYGALINSGFPLAYAFISLLTLALLTLVPADGVLAGYVQWGWRIPFALGGVFAIVLAFYYRRSVSESELVKGAAAASSAQSSAQSSPLRSLFQGANLRSFLLLVGAALTVLLIAVYSPWACLPSYICERLQTGVRASGYGLGYGLAVVLPSFYAFYQAGLALRLSLGYGPADVVDARHRPHRWELAVPDLRSVDLNLLVDLDALLATRSVSVAARRLNLSQSAMSGSLARLRKLFDDPLMVRNGRALTLTARAEDLVEPVREVLRGIDAVLAGPERFVPATAGRSFSISASDYATATLLAPLIRTLSVEAPHVTVNVRPRSDDVHALLRDDRVDLAIEPQETLGPSSLPSAALFRDRWLCVLDAAMHEGVARDGLDLDRYLSLPHLVYSIGQDMQLNLADRHLMALGLARRVELTIESFLLVPLMVRGTSLVSLILERTATLLPMDGLLLVEPPIPVPDINETMYWNPRHSADPAHQWLRAMVLATAGRVRPGSAP